MKKLCRQGLIVLITLFVFTMLESDLFGLAVGTRLANTGFSLRLKGIVENLQQDISDKNLEYVRFYIEESFKDDIDFVVDEVNGEVLIYLKNGLLIRCYDTIKQEQLIDSVFNKTISRFDVDGHICIEKIRIKKPGITGSTGAVGGPLTERIFENTKTLLNVFVRSHQIKRKQIFRSSIEKRISLFQDAGIQGILNFEELKNFVDESDFIIHLAAISRVGVGADEEVFAVNSLATAFLAYQASLQGKKMLFASTIKVYGLCEKGDEDEYLELLEDKTELYLRIDIKKWIEDACNNFIKFLESKDVLEKDPVVFLREYLGENKLPENVQVYALSKLLGEKLIERIYRKNMSDKFFLFRFSNIYGPGDNPGEERIDLGGPQVRMIPGFFTGVLKSYLTDTSMSIFKKQVNFVYIEDVLISILKAVELEYFLPAYHKFNICSSALIELGKIVEVMAEILGVVIDININRVLSDDPIYNIRKMREILKVSPTKVSKENLKVCIDWLIENNPVIRERYLSFEQKKKFEFLVKQLKKIKREVYLSEDDSIVFVENKLFYIDKGNIEGFNFYFAEEYLLKEADLIKQIFEYERQEYLRQRAMRKAFSGGVISDLVKYGINKNRIIAINILLQFMVKFRGNKFSFDIGLQETLEERKIKQRLNFRIKCIKQEVDGFSDRVLDIYREYSRECEDFRTVNIENIDYSSFNLKYPGLEREGVPYSVVVGGRSVSDWQLSVPGYIRPIKNWGGFQLVDRRDNTFSFIDKAEKTGVYNGGLAHKVCMTVEEHRRFIEQQQKRLVLYDINYENLFQNGHVVSWKHGVIHVPLSDLWDYNEVDSIDVKTYTSIVFWKNGEITGETIIYKEVYFDDEDKCYKGRLFIDGEDKSKYVDFTVYGPAVMMHGVCLEEYGIKKQLKAGEFQDLRHVFNFPKIKGDILEDVIKSMQGDTYFFGVQILTDNNYELAEKAYDETVEIDLKILYYKKENGLLQRKEKAFTIEQLREILASEYNANSRYIEKGKGADLQQGEFCVISETKIRIRLMHNYYPQMIVGVIKDKRLKVSYLPGASGTRGVTVKEAQDVAKVIGFESAVLVVNGGGVKFDIGRRSMILPTVSRISGPSNLFLMSGISIEDLTEEELAQLYLKLEYEQFLGYLDCVDSNREVFEKAA
jgi:nucleoside-diphosphate-sugar epimerase